MIRPALAMLASFVIGTYSHADILMVFQSTSPSQTVDIGFNGSNQLGNPVGPFNFEIVSSSDSRFSGTLKGFCADLHQGVTPKTSYTYQFRSVSDLPDIAGNANKLSLLQDLYDRFYDVSTDGARGGAFQIAQWEIIYDGGNGSSGLDLSSGNLTASSGTGETSIGIATNWLGQLSTAGAKQSKYTLVGLYSDSAQDQIAVVTNDDQPNPVPAPPAAILGLIALGVFGVRRVI